MITRRKKTTTEEDTFSIWTSFTDLMSNAFMVLTLLLLLALYQLQEAKEENKDNTPPPFREYSEAAGYKFNSGSATLSKKFKEDLKGKIKDYIEQTLKDYPDINVIEIIGHTDGQPIGETQCYEKNTGLDQELENVIKKGKNVKILCPNSNTDLGLMRAVSVMKELYNIQQTQGTPRFKKIAFRVYSAGQSIQPFDKIKSDIGNFADKDEKPNPKRRRIEIRFTELGRKGN